MNDERTSRPAAPLLWAILLVALVALVMATAALAATVLNRGLGRDISFSGMGGYGAGGMMGGHGAGGMMGGGMMGGGYGPGSGPVTVDNGAQPGESGFVAGTETSPRIIRVIAGPGLEFSPATIAVALGETVTFEVTTMGSSVHEFMVGPADAVAADLDGTPEVADIRMGQTKALTYAFAGSGPYAFACHAPGHYEAGMKGEITVVG